MRPLRQPRAGNQHATPDNPDRNQPPFLALDDLPPLAGVKLVRPRRCAAAGAPAGPLAARREDPGTCEEDPEEQSAQPRRQDVATGPDPYALLTVVALMGADERILVSRQLESYKALILELGNDTLVEGISRSAL